VTLGLTLAVGLAAESVVGLAVGLAVESVVGSARSLAAQTDEK